MSSKVVGTRISRYDSPRPDELANLKRDLDFTSAQMADLSDLANGSHWRKYTSMDAQRSLSMVRHFYMAALLVLSPEELKLIADEMKSHGAGVELGPLPAGAERA
ncbi:XRE family transcriptional regulator [Pseudomonas putida]